MLIRRGVLHFTNCCALAHSLHADVDGGWVRWNRLRLPHPGLWPHEERRDLGLIRVFSDQRDSDIVLEVPDNGHGMPTRQLADFFDRRSTSTAEGFLRLTGDFHPPQHHH